MLQWSPAFGPIRRRCGMWRPTSEQAGRIAGDYLMKIFGILLAVLLFQVVPARAGWEVNPADFEFSATLTAILVVDGAVAVGEENQLGAFVGEECRGVATPIHALDTWVFFMTIYANVAGETVRFRAFVPGEGIVLEIDEEIVLQPNEVYGEPIFPFELHASPGEHPLPVMSAISARSVDIPAGFLLEQGYPNPFNPSTLIGYALPVEGTVEMAVYDLLGKRVRTLVAERRSAGHWHTVWDGRDSRGVPVASGIYFYTMESGRFRATRKLLLLK